MIIAYVTSFTANSVEFKLSSRLITILRSLGLKYQIIDVNKEIIGQDQPGRNTLYKKGKLRSLNSKIHIPQIYLENKFLGYFDQFQYLIDCDMILPILQKGCCGHFQHFDQFLLYPSSFISFDGKNECINCLAQRMEFPLIAFYSSSIDNQKMSNSNISFSRILYENEIPAVCFDFLNPNEHEFIQSILI